jgi:hypothetical protein
MRLKISFHPLFIEVLIETEGRMGMRSKRKRFHPLFIEVLIETTEDVKEQIARRLRDNGFPSSFH